MARGVVLAAAVPAAALVAACSNGDETLSVENYCERIVDVQPLDDQLGQIETDSLEEGYQELRQLSESAPDDVRAPIDTLADFVGDVVEAMDGLDAGDVEATDEALRSLGSATLADAQTAGEEVERYTREQCGFDLRTGITVSPTTQPPTTAPPETTPVEE